MRSAGDEAMGFRLDSGGLSVGIEKLLGRALPSGRTTENQRLEQRFHALRNFMQMFDIRAGDRLVLLTDRNLDPRVVNAISGVALAQGVKPVEITMPNTQITELPDEVKPILDRASFVVSSWFCSVIDPYCVALRRDKGQRWVKITYFRDLDLLDAPHARFPVEIMSELIKRTAGRYPRGRDMRLAFADRRGTDLTIDLTAKMNDGNLDTNRWRGELLPTKPGAYVHYIPTHGPNLYERGPAVEHPDQVVPINGWVYPQWAVGFARPFVEPVGVRFADDRVVEVTGRSEEAGTLRDMLIGGRIIELGCGFNPKWPRHSVYPAGSNSPGVLHYGIDLVKPSDYIKKTMPNWEEPPIHMDLVSFDTTVKAGDNALVTDGFLESLRDPEVVALAARYGDPVDLPFRGWNDPAKAEQYKVARLLARARYYPGTPKGITRMWFNGYMATPGTVKAHEARADKLAKNEEIDD